MSKEAARYRVLKGIQFLNGNVPGWFERVRKTRHFDMWTFDHCLLATACYGQVLNGQRCYTAGDVCRATGIDGAALGFYDDEKSGITYRILQDVWGEILANSNPPGQSVTYSKGFIPGFGWTPHVLQRLLKAA
jgi:hypothetical protein